MSLQKLILFSLISLLTTANILSQNIEKHPRIFADNGDRQELLLKIENQDWAKNSWNTLLEEINPYVNRHVNNPEWIVSRLAMYWKKGEHFTTSKMRTTLK